MNRTRLLLAAIAVSALVASGCAGIGSPVSPDADPDLVPDSQTHRGSSNSYLWGYYDVTIDIETGEITAVPNRTMQFSANVVSLLNSMPMSMLFSLNDLEIGAEKIICDIDVTIVHPFGGKPQLSGYDVKGVFLGDASGVMDYNGMLRYPVYEVDQFMTEDPDTWTHCEGPDGYTRWFNAIEFPVSGLFGYTQGELATKGFTPTATLCPYKYFADGLGADDDVWEYLNAYPENRGVFSSGSSNSRRYDIEFPLPSPGLCFGYAVVANWIDPVTHPANAIEAPAISVNQTPEIYITCPDEYGGNITLDIDVWGWEHQPSRMFIESDTLDNAYMFNAMEMTPVGGGEHYSTYHVEVPVDFVDYWHGHEHEYWVICQYDEFDYTSELTPPGGAPLEPLCAFFRCDLEVHYEPYDCPPEIDLQLLTPMPVEDWSPICVEFDASGSYDPEGCELVYHWDFDGDGEFDEDPDDAYFGEPSHPIHAYKTDYSGEVTLEVYEEWNYSGPTESVSVDVTAWPSKNFEITYGDSEPVDIAIDHKYGDILVYYADIGMVRRYRRGDWKYQDQYFSEYDVEADCEYIDMSLNGDFFIASSASSPSSQINTWHYTHNGQPINANQQGYGDEFPITLCDVVAMGKSGPWQDSHFWFGYLENSPTEATMLSAEYVAQNYILAHEYSMNQTPSFGPDQLYGPWIMGSEAESGLCVWHVQHGSNIRASRWYVDHEYAGYSWGTGVPTDGPGGMNDPYDITRDGNGYFYILDELWTSELACKIFFFDLDEPETIHHYFPDLGDLEYTSGVGKCRIDASLSTRYLAVLHASEIGGENHYFFSTWKDKDLPN